MRRGEIALELVSSSLYTDHRTDDSGDYTDHNDHDSGDVDCDQ